MIVRRETLAAVLPAATSDDTRYFLKGVHFDPAAGIVVATDGHVLLTAKERIPYVDEDFPIVPGAPFHGNPAPIMASSDVIAGLIKTMPKKGSLGILQTVQLSQTGSEDTATLAATDLEAPRVATLKRDGQSFPNYSRVFPKADRPAVTVILAIDVLEALIKSAKAVAPSGKHATPPTIAFNVPTAGSDLLDGTVVSALGIHIAGEHIDVDGCAMPCRGAKK